MGGGCQRHSVVAPVGRAPSRPWAPVVRATCGGSPARQSLGAVRRCPPGQRQRAGAVRPAPYRRAGVVCRCRAPFRRGTRWRGHVRRGGQAPAVGVGASVVVPPGQTSTAGGTARPTERRAFVAVGRTFPPWAHSGGATGRRGAGPPAVGVAAVVVPPGKLNGGAVQARALQKAGVVAVASISGRGTRWREATVRRGARPAGRWCWPSSLSRGKRQRGAVRARALQNGGRRCLLAEDFPAVAHSGESHRAGGGPGPPAVGVGRPSFRRAKRQRRRGYRRAAYRRRASLPLAEHFPPWHTV